MKFTYLSLIFLQVTFSYQQNDLSKCPSTVSHHSTLKTYGQKCYEYVLNRQDDWRSAMQDCRFKQGHLVTIESPEEQLVVYNGLLAANFQGDGVWIGLNDRGSESHFVWDSGKTSTYRNWAKGQPGVGHLVEDCVLFKMAGSDGNGKWHDFPCDQIIFNPQYHSWICEYGGDERRWVRVFNVLTNDSCE